MTSCAADDWYYGFDIAEYDDPELGAAFAQCMAVIRDKLDKAYEEAQNDERVKRYLDKLVGKLAKEAEAANATDLDVYGEPDYGDVRDCALIGCFKHAITDLEDLYRSPGYVDWEDPYRASGCPGTSW